MNFMNEKEDTIPKCSNCDYEFEWSDMVVEVNGEIYHEHCVQLYPTGYVAFLDGEFLGDVENDEPVMASDIFDELL